MATERYVVRPVWQVVYIHTDGQEIVAETLPDEATARAAVVDRIRESERLERAAVQLSPRNCEAMITDGSQHH